MVMDAGTSPRRSASASEILEFVRTRLGGDVRGLSVEFDDDDVLLRGACNSFYQKQVAQETARLCVSGRRVLNLITVE